MVGILDIGAGNLRSMENAIDQCGFDPIVVREASGMIGLSHLVIPGVGNFSAAMPEMVSRDLVPAVQAFARSGRPLLGVCLGMHLLASLGEEGGQHRGFDLIPATVRRLSPGTGLRLPHMGWNGLEVRRPHAVFNGIKPNRDFYFVHSFGMVVDNEADVLATTDYGEPIAAVVGRGNVIGFQFHPEKSQVNGLRLLENFCVWDGQC